MSKQPEGIPIEEQISKLLPTLIGENQTHVDLRTIKTALLNLAETEKIPLQEITNQNIHASVKKLFPNFDSAKTSKLDLQDSECEIYWCIRPALAKWNKMWIKHPASKIEPKIAILTAYNSSR